MARLPEFRYHWTWKLPASPEALWPLVSDTNRFNRDTGLPPVDDAREEGQELANGARRLRFESLGLTVEWNEQPFEWTRPRRFGVVRRYSRGPLKEMRIRAELEPAPDGGTLLSYAVTASPSGLLGLATIPIGIGLLSRLRFGRAFRTYAGEARQEAGTAEGPPRGLGSAISRKSALRQRLTAHGADPELAEHLSRHLVAADDLSTARMRPYTLADLWGVPRGEALLAFLKATRAGVLELRWSLLCPLCRGAKDEVGRLRELRTQGAHCDTCRIDFSVEMDRSVELTFTPHPSVRRVRAPTFCVAGPQITPHILVQQLLGPGESRTIEPHLPPGRYRIRTLSARHGAPLLESDPAGRAEARFELGSEGWSTTVDEPVFTRPTLHLRNGQEEEHLVIIERTAWADDAVTGAEVTAVPEFRDLFSGEVLSAGEFLSVGSMAVAFTDLRASTALYRAVGDAPAFGRVMRHFEVLERAIAAEGGTLVKTIGDAVMAIFQEPAPAVRALARAHRELAEWPDLVLKSGVHYGPCFIVTLNERLDYFGTTVNAAARLEGLSRGGDIVFSERVREGLADESLPPGLGPPEAIEDGAGELKGIEDELFRPWRLTVLDPTPRGPESSA